MMRVMRVKRVSSMNAIKPSNMRALLGKCRYSAASETPTSAANAAVVMRPPGLFASMRGKHLQDLLATLSSFTGHAWLRLFIEVFVGNLGTGCLCR